MPDAKWADHFEKPHKRSADPWNLTNSAYEVSKYAATLAALEGRHFASGLEIGCAMGTLTQRLAPECDAYLDVDLLEPPLVDARARCAHLPQARFEKIAIPTEWPQARFDLIVRPEMLYFLPLAELERLATRCADTSTGRHPAAGQLAGAE